MKIGVVIPDQNNRSEFLSQCLKYIGRQTVRPDHIELINDESGLEKDLTWRYRVGCDRLKKKTDVILFMENDDWYSEKYIESMVTKWQASGRHDIFGLSETIYYNLNLRKYIALNHPGRASAMSTLIRSDAVDKIKWPKPECVNLDRELWRQLSGHAMRLDDIICIGIKHGQGNCGGSGHNENWRAYDNAVGDQNGNWLKGITGKDYEFYEKLMRGKT